MKRKKLSQIWLSDGDIIERWFKYCKMNDLIYKQPESSLERDDKYAYLTNWNGELARFNLNNHRFEFADD